MPDGPDAAPEASDTELLSRILAGDKDLFEILVRRYDRRLFRVARAILHTDFEAEDVVQASFVRAFEHLGDFEGRGLFSTWLTRIALREAMSRKRAWRRRADAELAQAKEIGATAAVPASERKVLQHEVRDLLESAIRKMPEPYRLVF